MKSLKYLGDKIRYLRMEKEYSQEYMADMLGVSQTTYSRIEKEADEVNLKLLQDISEILEISLEQLLSSAGSNFYFGDNQDNSSSQQAPHGNINIYNFPKETLQDILNRLEELEKGKS